MRWYVATVLLGRLVLGERLGRRQNARVALARRDGPP